MTIKKDGRAVVMSLCFAGIEIRQQNFGVAFKPEIKIN